MNVIIQNEAKCLNCGDQIYSAFRHDYKSCTCGNITVDGGQSYVLHGWIKKELREDKSVFMEKELAAELVDAIDEGGKTLTSFGILCKVMRTLRDAGYDVKGEE